MKYSGRGVEDYDEQPLRTVSLTGIPSFIKGEHEAAMRRFYTLLMAITQAAPNREVPLTRKEVFENGIDKKSYKTLLKAGWLKETIIPLYRTSDKKPVGARAVVFFTPQGRAFIRSAVDANYALTENH